MEGTLRSGAVPAARERARGAPPLLLLPGLEGTGYLFYRQIPELSQSFRVEALPLRDEASSMEELVADVQAAVERLAPGGSAVIAGESFGGALALRFAIERPQCVRALVVINSFPYLRPRSGLWLTLAALHLVPWQVMQYARRMLVSRLLATHVPPGDVSELLDRTAGVGRDGYLRRLRMLRSHDVRYRLGAIRAPALFVASDRDRLLDSVRAAREMAARMPRAAVRVLPGQGHVCLISPQVSLARILADWAASERIDLGGS